VKRLLVLMVLAALGYWVYQRFQPPEDDWDRDFQALEPIAQS
jgi:hypothetical protein